MTTPSMTGMTPDAAGALAMRWLSSLLDALDSGVLQVAPDVSPDQQRQIAREMWLLRSYWLSRMHSALGTSPDQFATIHLRQGHHSAVPEDADGDSLPSTRPRTQQRRGGGAACC
jgi:hypothetical protein